jgi:hypothetical protein
MMVFLLSAYLSPMGQAGTLAALSPRKPNRANRVISVAVIEAGEGGESVLARLASAVGFAPSFLLFSFSSHGSTIRPKAVSMTRRAICGTTVWPAFRDRLEPLIGHATRHWRLVRVKTVKIPNCDLLVITRCNYRLDATWYL